MNRGDVYWVDLNPSQGAEINKLRPCVIVGATVINQVRRTVVVVPLSTSATARPPLVINVECLGKTVTAVCDQIRTVDKKRLAHSAGRLSAKNLTSLDESLRQVLCL
jgi:mRNA interferase MazF